MALRTFFSIILPAIPVALLPVVAASEARGRAMWADVKNPHIVTEALADAVVSAFSLHFKSMDYYAFRRSLGDTNRLDERPVPFPAELCDASRVEHDGLTLRCRIVAPIYEGCSNMTGCAAIALHPSVLADDNLRAVIMRAVQNPCGFLKDQDELRRETGAQGYKARGLILSTGARRVLRCGASRFALRLEDITVDARTGRLEAKW